MKKILDLLEQKIQWIVLAIAVLYVGWAAYSYVMVPPVTVTIDGKTLAPGEIDREIVDKVVVPLEQKIKDSRVLHPATAPSLVSQFVADMSYEKDKAPVWADAPVVFQQLPPIKLAEATNTAGTGPRTASIPKGTGTAELPKIPAPRFTALRSGLTSVVPPGQPAPNGVALAAMTGIDKSWVSIRFDIDPKDLAQAFDDAKVSPDLSNTTFVQVKLERQEQMPDGSWGPVTVVPTLAGITVQPPPPANAPTSQVVQYFDWAKTHQVDILQPKFYDRIKGDEWLVPGTTANAAAPAPFDPSKFPTQTREELVKLGLKPAEIDQVFEYRRSHPATPNRGNTAPRGTRAPVPPRPRPARPGTPAPAPDAPAPVEYNFAPDAPADRQVSYQAATEEPAPVDAPTNPGDPAAAPAAQQGTFPMPGGMFDPHTYVSGNAAIPTIVGWAHDETATPGHTYRYRVTYMIKNPVYLANNYVKDPATAKVIAIASAPSEWSTTVEISSTVNFFIVKRGSAPNSVTVEVFRNQGGAINRKAFDVSAGDMIGGKDANVDYTTGWTMVDLRNDPKTDTELYVLLIDPSGTIHRRDLSVDTKNPTYKALSGQVAGAAGAPGAPKPPGAVAAQ